MKMRFFILIALFSILPIAATADNPEVENFKVSGVQLGMPAQEAVDAIVAHYSIDPAELDVQRFPDAIPTTDYVEAIDYIEYYGDDLVILMTFSPDLERKEDGYMLLSELQIDGGPMSFQEKLRIALSEYGPQSVIDKGRRPEDENGWDYHWCEKILANGLGCDDDYAGLEINRGITHLFTDAYDRKFDDQLSSSKDRSQ